MILNQNYVTVHPNFHEPTPYNNDIALIKLKVAMRSSATLSPVCLPTPKSCLPDGNLCAVSGWGNNERLDSDRYPDVLQEAAVKLSYGLAQRSRRRRSPPGTRGSRAAGHGTPPRPATPSPRPSSPPRSGAPSGPDSQDYVTTPGIPQGPRIWGRGLLLFEELA